MEQPLRKILELIASSKLDEAKKGACVGGFVMHHALGLLK
jgi:hypothetical protein